MTEVLNNYSKFYQTPPKLVLQSRKIFYSLQKLKEEPVLEWLRRLKIGLDRCVFGTLADFLLIDKFICELSNDEIHELMGYIGTLSVDRLLEALDGQTIYIENNVEEDEAQGDAENNWAEMKLDVVSVSFLITNF